MTTDDNIFVVISNVYINVAVRGHRTPPCIAHLPTTRSHCFNSDPAAVVLLVNAFGIRCVNLARVINSSENIFTSFASSVRISCCVNSALVAHCVRSPSNRSADMSIILWMTSSPCRILFVSYSTDWFVVILSLAIPSIHARDSQTQSTTKSITQLKIVRFSTVRRRTPQRTYVHGKNKTRWNKKKPNTRAHVCCLLCFLPIFSWLCRMITKISNR